MTSTLVIHIAAGGVALIAGFVALFASKGANAHRKGGLVFVFAMLVMALTGAFIALVGGSNGSVIAGLLAGYLVATGLMALRLQSPRWLLTGLMTVALTIGTGSLILGMSGPTDGIPPFIYFKFGTVALLGAFSDVRVLRRGAPQGALRLRRHLWRMCFALYIASASFFLGQADEFPAALRIPALLAIPAFLPLIFMAYWLFKTRQRRTVHAQAAAFPGAA